MGKIKNKKYVPECFTCECCYVCQWCITCELYVAKEKSDSKPANIEGFIKKKRKKSLTKWLVKVISYCVYPFRVVWWFLWNWDGFIKKKKEKEKKK